MTRVHGFEVSARSHSVLEKGARRLRELLGIDPIEYLPGVQLFESLDRLRVKVEGRPVNVSYDIRALPAEAQTEYDSERDEITVVLSEETYGQLRHDVARARFSLAHELGHVCFHPSLTMKLSMIPHEQAALMRGKEPSHKVYCDTEWQANAFAAALLMPARGLHRLEEQHGADAILYITERYGVSGECGSYRWETYQAKKVELMR
jgi:hypothetical protein